MELKELVPIVVAVVTTIGAVIAAWLQHRKAMPEEAPRAAGRSTASVGSSEPPPSASTIPSSSVRLASGERFWLAERTPHEVFKALQAIKRPLQADAMAKASYVGRWARWTGPLFDVKPLEGGGFLVSVDWGTSLIFINLAQEEHHIVDALMKGDIVEYEGYITEVEGFSASLDHGRILSVTKPSAPGKTSGD